MFKSLISLPKEIGSKVRVQSADQAGLAYMQWRGFQSETVSNGGWHIMRRDFHDDAFGHYPEPSPPKFPIHAL